MSCLYPIPARDAHGRKQNHFQMNLQSILRHSTGLSNEACKQCFISACKYNRQSRQNNIINILRNIIERETAQLIAQPS